MNILIKVENLKKVYESKVAVNGISFDVQKGQIYGFLGTNGAGKSTTIKMLTGQLQPTEGKISICGIDPVKESKKLAYKIGVIPEKMSLYEDFTVIENLSIFAKLYGLSNRNVEEQINKLGLCEHKNFKIKQLSKGYKQRVLIARALLHNPEIIFMDEPTSGLDVLIANEIRKIIIDLKEQGKTIFLTTHYMDEAEKLCDYVSIIKDGDILEKGSPYELKLKYGSRYITVKSNGIEQKIRFDELNQINRFLNNGIETIHSEESSLEEVFIEVMKGK